MTGAESGDTFAALPDPGRARTLDELTDMLRSLKVWAGDPSYESITTEVNTAWAAAGRPASELTKRPTVVDCFKPGRRRLKTDLVIAIVQSLHPDVGYVTQWRQALRVIAGETRAAAQVRVQGTLPQELAGFTGRTGELDQLCRALHRAQREGGAVVISAISGMAGVGKTQLAVRAGHLLTRERPIDRVLFVNLRGFDPDPAQPPADPAAVLDGFLRLLGVPGQQIPHGIDGRVAAYRKRLAGTRTLVVLDNAADTEQIRPLLPETAGSLTLVTSRRNLTDLHPATHLAVDVFTPDEAVDFLTRNASQVPVGDDPHAATRIAARCGYLPLALGLIAGHIRSTPGWTLTDHADRLDERHRLRHLDSEVELALDLSYQHLPADHRRMLRLAALHPGQDIDAYAIAALADTELDTAQDQLRHLCRDHLLQQATAGRYTFHDLVRAYALARASDQDPPPERRAAMTRVLGYYLATTSAAMNILHPACAHRWPRIPPAGTPTPVLSDRERADVWLDTELPNLLAAAQYAAEHGWPEHVWLLSATVDRHLRTRGHHRDAETLHQQALYLAQHHGDLQAEVNALNSLGYVRRKLGRLEQARDHHERALRIAQRIGDRVGELNAMAAFGVINWLLGRHEQAGDHHERALRIAQDIGDRVGELNALTALGNVQQMLGRYEHARGYLERALRIAQRIGDRVGELNAQDSLGTVQRLLGRYEQAGDHYGRALRIAQDIGDRVGELYARHGLGSVHQMLGRYELAGDHYGRALRIAQDIGDRVGELNALSGLGHIRRMLGRHSEAAGYYRKVLDFARALGNRNWQFEALQGLGRMHYATGHPDLAIIHHEQALQHATDLNQAADQARAHDGLAHAYDALHDHDRARKHWQQALNILSGLGTEHTEDIEASAPNIRAHLTTTHKVCSHP